MNGVHLNGKARGSEKVIPGCLGRMVNLFDLSSGLSGNPLLTDKPHNEGSLSRSRSYVSRISSIAGDDIEDKVMVSDTRRSSSNRKPNDTPVKMLIAEEMSKDFELRQNSPNVVAKLMGLDALPKQQPDIATQRTHSKCCTRKCHSNIPIGYWQEEGSFFPEKGDGEFHSHQTQTEFKDIHEILQQSQRANFQRDKSPQKLRSNENVNDKKLCLVRQKFTEAKRLATDEKLRQTKEFQDALDVLSSNGDLFLKVLQEPNSVFTQNLSVGRSIPSSPDTKRITLLRPSKMMADDMCTVPAGQDEKQVKRQLQVNQINLWENHPNGFSPTISTQPIRIVVLKPNPSKVNGFRTAASSTPSSPRAPESEVFFPEPGTEAQEAREVAKEITQQMRQNLALHRRDEILLSSVFSNGYSGDESSFEKSVNEFTDGNLSDPEVMSPTSRQSWEYVNRFDSPYSITSFGRASYSPESSVCREAKKRLSERWAMMSSSGSHQEQRQFHRSSSTLGEMLALSEVKKSEICEEDSNDKDEDPRVSSSIHNKSVGARESGEDSPRNLLRSKFVPISFKTYGEGMNVQVSEPVVCKVDIQEEVMKAKAPKTSFTGKVTSLFFSKNKKSRKEKSGKLQSNDESQSVTSDTSGSLALPERASNDHSEVSMSPSEARIGTVLVDMTEKRLGQDFHQFLVFLYGEPSAIDADGFQTQLGTLSVPQLCTHGTLGGHQDQPSPISILEQLFEDDEGAMPSCSLSFDPHVEKSLAHSHSKFNLIDKSPPIGSIARTMSWDESCAETATSYPLDSPFVSPGADNDEGEWLSLVQSLLTMAGLNNEEQVGSNLARWHTPNRPLDPLLRVKYIDLSSKEPLYEAKAAKRRQLRSFRKLVFDCVNTALIDITGFGTPASQWSALCNETRAQFLDSGSSSSLADKVWAWMKECLPDDRGDSDSSVERLVMKEVVGTGRSNQLNFEVDDIGKEIEGKLLEELVEESLVQWTSRD